MKKYYPLATVYKNLWAQLYSYKPYKYTRSHNFETNYGMNCWLLCSYIYTDLELLYDTVYGYKKQGPALNTVKNLVKSVVVSKRHWKFLVTVTEMYSDSHYLSLPFHQVFFTVYHWFWELSVIWNCLQILKIFLVAQPRKYCSLKYLPRISVHYKSVQLTEVVALNKYSFIVPLLTQNGGILKSISDTLS